jgi:hypothetical protein
VVSRGIESIMHKGQDKILSRGVVGRRERKSERKLFQIEESTRAAFLKRNHVILGYRKISNIAFFL